MITMAAAMRSVCVWRFGAQIADAIFKEEEERVVLLLLLSSIPLHHYTWGPLNDARKNLRTVMSALESILQHRIHATSLTKPALGLTLSPLQRDVIYGLSLGPFCMHRCSA